jgi:hypothetical protein
LLFVQLGADAVECEHPDKSWQAAAKATVMGIRR